VSQYQRDYYDSHYSTRGALLRAQLTHPLFSSFYSRLARRVLDHGAVQLGEAVAAGMRPLRVLELGCGEGLLAAALARVASEAGAEIAYTGSDISASALDLARRAAPGEFVVGDASDVAAGLQLGGFDLVVVKNLLHHLSNPAEFLRRASALLAPGGRLVAAEASRGSPQAWFFSVLAPRRERYFFVYGKARTRRFFGEAGYRLIRVEPFSFLPYELFFAIRPGVFRRLVNPGKRQTVCGVDALDDRLTRLLPALCSYRIWVGSPTGGRAR